MIHGIPVTLYEPTQTGTDAFHAPITEDTPVTVENVLVCPTEAQEIVQELALYGKRSEYELLIPKGDTHQWEDRKIGFFGLTFRSFGPVAEYIDANVPGPWNRKVKVERYG